MLIFTYQNDKGKTLIRLFEEQVNKWTYPAIDTTFWGGKLTIAIIM